MIHKEALLEIKYIEYEVLGELPSVEKAIAQKAMEIARNAYANYSGFKVGAAVLLDNGEVCLGTNQENVSYPVGVCAEQVALYSAHTLFPREPVVKIAIAAISGNSYTSAPIVPCGKCRQALLESENRFGVDIQIIMTGEDKIIIVNSAKDLLPFAFEKKNFKTKI